MYELKYKHGSCPYWLYNPEGVCVSVFRDIRHGEKVLEMLNSFILKRFSDA